jgi:hypothetical protein
VISRTLLSLSLLCLHGALTGCSEGDADQVDTTRDDDDSRTPERSEDDDEAPRERDAGGRSPNERDAASSRPDAKAPSGGPKGGDASAATGADAGSSLPSDIGKLGEAIKPGCEGFALEGLMESPGGDVMPNKCHPFHPTLNNPYAVRCIDAWPWYKTPYPGDEYCILPPPEGKGIQVGFHPQEGKYWEQVSKKDLSGYDKPGADWLLAAGGEATRSYHAPVANPTEKMYYRTYFRMRTGSHHNIITMHDKMEPPGWNIALGEALPGNFDPTAGTQIGTLGGQERPDDNTPVTHGRPPEDEGLYLKFPVNPNILYNVHHFNTTKGAILKEGWVNIWWEEEGSQVISWFMGMESSQVVTLNVPPGQSRDLHYKFAPTEPVRIVRFFGHRHVWTSNFSGWVERQDGKVDMIYQSFDWMDMPTYRYDSVVKNPAPDAERRADGATSGVLTVNPGDELHFNCHIEYTEARAAEEMAPSPRMNGNLRFANQALTAEMCIAFGNVTGGTLGKVMAATEPLPPGVGK